MGIGFLVGTNLNDKELFQKAAISTMGCEILSITIPAKRSFPDFTPVREEHMAIIFKRSIYRGRTGR